MSLISVTLCCISSLSIDSKMAAKRSHTSSRTYSELSICVLMPVSTSAISMGSDIRSTCPSSISASLLPTLFLKVSAILLLFCFVCSKALLKSSNSVSQLSIVRFFILSSTSFIATALPMPIPTEAPIPFNISYLLKIYQ